MYIRLYAFTYIRLYRLRTSGYTRLRVCVPNIVFLFFF